MLFCDLVGSTEIASRVDPEEWREIVGNYHRAAAQAIERFGGHVAQYLGDGVMAYFGWPEAHDNDAERAARAGLAILDAISKLNEHPTHPKLAARVGIDSGAVVVGAGAGKEVDVFGDTPNVAARVQAAAQPGTVLITEALYRLVHGLFLVEDRGTAILKGIELPLQLYRVVQPSVVRGRLQAVAAARGLTPFVGRDDELRSLINRWERALDGEGQVALIIGEAGIGKSRLVHRFREQIAGTPHTWIEGTAAPFFQGTPFYPIVDVLHQLVWEQSFRSLDEYLRELQAPGASKDGSKAESGESFSDDQFAGLQSGLVLAGLEPAQAIPLIAPLLNLPLSTKYPPSQLSPEHQRRRLLATLVDWLLGATRVQPVVIAIEDLHWADPSTLELLQLLAEQGATSRLLLLCTARPEFHVPWPLRAHHAQITLNRLSASNIRAMVLEVAARKALSDETVATVVERTGGVPLFAEELTRVVLESAEAKLSGSEIPVTLHDSLMARLDRLGAAKEVVQVGAVIGGEFSYDLLHAVHPIAEEDLQRALRKLADAEMLYVRGIAPDAKYQFKHALIRDAAYEALLKSRRRDLHRLVARAIDEKFVVIREARPEVLARHWTAAGETERAIAEWSRAGRAMEARSAFREALESYRRALALLRLLPDSPERDGRELELTQFVHGMLWLTKGPSEAETLDAAERAAALAEKSGNIAHLIKSMITRGNIALDSGDLAAARGLADQALELAHREGHPACLGMAYDLEIATCHYQGDLPAAENYFTLGLKMPSDDEFNHSPGVVIPAPERYWQITKRLGFASWNAWLLGRPDVARERMARAMAAANRDSNPFDIAHSGYIAARLRIYLREYEQVEGLEARTLELAEKHRFQILAALSRVSLGQARAHLGKVEEGITLIRLGIAGMVEIGSRSGVSRVTAALAEAQARAGSIVEALETVEQALKANPGEFAYRPETLRLRGELRIKQGQTAPAEDDFREAITLARSMSAKAWELRATMSLARLLHAHGRRDEACTMLAEIFGWFTEGFDTADLKDAKSLLEQLGA